GLNYTLHWDGSTWTRVPIPVQRQLFSVAVLSAADAWAVGQYEPVTQRGLILHNTGSGWVQVPSTAPQSIFDTSFVNPSDGWATSTAITTSYILHYDGVQWSSVFTNHYQIDRLFMLS